MFRLFFKSFHISALFLYYSFNSHLTILQLIFPPQFDQSQHSTPLFLHPFYYHKPLLSHHINRLQLYHWIIKRSIDGRIYLIKTCKSIYPIWLGDNVGIPQTNLMVDTGCRCKQMTKSTYFTGF